MSITTQTRLLLGLTLLGASLTLPAGGANAAPISWCATLPCTPGATATIGDKLFTAIQGPTLGSGVVDVDVTPTPDHPLPRGVYQVDVDFDPLLVNGTAAPITGIFKYKVDIQDPSYFFNTASLLWSGQNSSITKKIYSDDLFANLVQSLNINGEEKSIPGALKSIWVEDTYTIQPNGYLDNMVNTYTQVPGPLPLVGAGAAFTFSRRLRRRTKKAYKLG
jgi:hypothetical protein